MFTKPKKMEGTHFTLLAGEEASVCFVCSCVRISEFIFRNKLVCWDRHGQVKCVRMLLGKGAKVLADKNGVSSLELCAQVRVYEMHTHSHT